jgi:hypothetical protein
LPKEEAAPALPVLPLLVSNVGAVAPVPPAPTVTVTVDETLAAGTLIRV